MKADTDATAAPRQWLTFRFLEVAHYWAPGVSTDDLEGAKATLEQVKVIAQSAVERAATADRRASIAGTVAIAASFTLSGAGIILDEEKVPNRDVRLWLAILLSATTIFFALSGVYALRTLVANRYWSWSLPIDLRLDAKEPTAEQISRRAAHLLHDFGRNWEVADVMNRNVDLALQCLLAALFGIVGLSVLLAIYVA